MGSVWAGCRGRERLGQFGGRGRRRGGHRRDGLARILERRQGLLEFGVIAQCRWHLFVGRARLGRYGCELARHRPDQQ
jgi:hypothetical protein